MSVKVEKESREFSRLFFLDERRETRDGGYKEFKEFREFRGFGGVGVGNTHLGLWEEPHTKKMRG